MERERERGTERQRERERSGGEEKNRGYKPKAVAGPYGSLTTGRRGVLHFNSFVRFI